MKVDLAPDLFAVFYGERGGKVTSEACQGLKSLGELILRLDREEKILLTVAQLAVFSMTAEDIEEFLGMGDDSTSSGHGPH